MSIEEEKNKNRKIYYIGVALARTKCHRSNYGRVLHRIIRRPRPEICENLTMVYNIRVVVFNGIKSKR